MLFSVTGDQGWKLVKPFQATAVWFKRGREKGTEAHTRPAAVITVLDCLVRSLTAWVGFVGTGKAGMGESAALLVRCSVRKTD